MVYSVQHARYGNIIYDESIWTGKKIIKINGVTLTKISKKYFKYDSLEETVTVQLIGNLISGVTLLINGEKVQMSPKSTWYELFFTWLPFVFVMIFGNVPSLFAIFPVVAGALGGLISAFCGIIGLFIMKSTKNPIFKIIIGILAFAATCFICNSIAIALLQLAG